MWACLDCKKKQEAILKSDQWLNSPVLNKKNYTSDYILNKGAFKIINSSNFNEIDSQNDYNNDGDDAVGNSRESNKRVLPKLNKNFKQTSVDQIETNEKFHIIKELCGQNDPLYETNTFTTLPKSNLRKSLKQPLIKQASLNNPPIYFQNLNSDYFQDESSLYENSTSNQELRKATSSFLVKNNNLNNECFSSPSSSISKLHTSRSSLNRKSERLQDPVLMFKNRNSSTNSTSRLNVSNADLDDANVDELTLYDREKNLNKQTHNQPKQPLTSLKDTNRNSTSNESSNSNILKLIDESLKNSIDLMPNSSNDIKNLKDTAINQIFRYLC